MWSDINWFGSVIRTCLDRYNTAFWCHMHSVQKHVASTHAHPAPYVAWGSFWAFSLFSLLFSLALFLSISSVLSLFFFSSFFVLVFSFLRSVTSATGPPPLHLDSPYAHTPLSHIAQVSQSVTAGLLMFSVSHVSIHSSCTICPKAKITHVPFRSGAGLMYAVQIIQLVKDALCVCVCVVLCACLCHRPQLHEVCCPMFSRSFALCAARFLSYTLALKSGAKPKLLDPGQSSSSFSHP